MRYRFSCLKSYSNFNAVCFESQEVFVSIWGKFVGVGRTQRDKGCCFALAIGCGGKMSLLEEIGRRLSF